MHTYQRREAGRQMLDALSTLGGSASREAIKKSMADDKNSGFSYEDIFEPITSKSGQNYIPFNFDFNFGLRNLWVLGYIEEPKRGADITLTEKGRSKSHDAFPTEREQARIKTYWLQKHRDNV
jgi:restriction system protein